MKLKDTQALTSFKYGWLLKRVFPYIKPIMGRVILGFLIAIPVGLLDGIVSFSLKPYMDYVVGEQNLIIGSHEISYSLLAVLMPFGIIFFALFQGILRYLNAYFTDWTSFKMTNAVKKDLFARLVFMDTSFFDENSSGIVINRYLTDSDEAAKSLVDQIKCFLVSLFGAVSLIAVMLYSSWKLAVVGVLVLAFAFLPIIFIRKKIKSTSNRNTVINGDMTTIMNETYSGNKVVSGYNLQSRQIKLFNKAIDESFSVMISLTKRAGWMSPVMYLIASFGIAFVLYYGTRLIHSGSMTAGSFASFVTSLLLLYKPIKTLGNTLTKFQSIFVALGRVFELFDYVPTIKDKPQTVALQDLHSDITFENVCFAYNESKTVLKNINLCVKEGETIAIVGNSGGGKSTLVNLLPRFYDVTQGAVKFDGIDIRDLLYHRLRCYPCGEEWRDERSIRNMDEYLGTGTYRRFLYL